ncbi:MAG: Adenylate cyclase [Alphaproteobacteria bacterium]|nr:Adenylate cyclase [Alphaproteobacteria bacterium]
MASTVNGGRASDRLKSWKEIAAFFGSEVRTVQRWEKRGLPIRRVPGGDRPTVYAEVAELKAWLAQGQGRAATEALALPWLRRSGSGIAMLAAAAIVLSVAAGVVLSHRTGASALPAAAAHRPGPRATELYLTGSYNLERRTPDSLVRARSLFEQAIAEDPAYAEAYAGLADCYLLLREFSGMPAPEAYARARAAARSALALDGSLAQGHAALGFVTFFWSKDYPAGLESLRRSIRLDPGSATAYHWYATALAQLGRFDEAERAIAAAASREPGSRSILADKGLILFYSNRADQAEYLLRQVEANDRDFFSAHQYLARIYLSEGRDRDYLSEAAIAARLKQDPDQLAQAEAARRGYGEKGHSGLLRGLLAARLATWNHGRGQANDVAAAYALLGDRRRAIAYLAIAQGAGEITLRAVQSDPQYHRLIGDPSFKRLAASHRIA